MTMGVVAAKCVYFMVVYAVYVGWRVMVYRIRAFGARIGLHGSGNRCLIGYMDPEIGA